MSKIKTALITGITGQDGSYLAEFLLNKNYQVHGIKRRSSLFNTQRIDHIFEDPKVKDLIIHHGDMTDSTSLNNIVKVIKPDEIYNLAAQSHVAVSFEQPEYTANSDAIGTLRLLEAIRMEGLTKKTKFYQASTSELYGKVLEVPQTEQTPFYPRSLTPFQNFLLTGQQLIIEKLMEYLPVMEFYLTMKVQGEVKPL